MPKQPELIVAAGPEIVLGSDFQKGDSGLWVPGGYIPPIKNPTFLPDSAYQAAVADVKKLFETGSFSYPSASVWLTQPKPEPEPYNYEILGPMKQFWLKQSGHSKGTEDTLKELFPGLDSEMGDCHICGWDGGLDLADIIIHLNDTHEYTREQIADWLDTLDIDLTLTTASKGD